MNIHLTPNAAQFIQQQIATGVFADEDEVVDAALQLLRNKQEKEPFSSLIPSNDGTVDECVYPPCELPFMGKQFPVKIELREGSHPLPDPIFRSTIFTYVCADRPS